MAFLGTALSFLGSNIKWVAILALIAALSFAGFKYTKLVSDYAIARNTITQLQQTVKDKDATIKFERDLRFNSEKIIAEQKLENDKLEEQLKNITDDLGTDSNDLAPESIREIIRRLQGLQ